MPRPDGLLEPTPAGPPASALIRTLPPAATRVHTGLENLTEAFWAPSEVPREALAAQVGEQAPTQACFWQRCELTLALWIQAGALEAKPI